MIISRVTHCNSPAGCLGSRDPLEPGYDGRYYHPGCPDRLETPGDIYWAGYTTGKRAAVGESLPHPGNYADPGMFWHGMRAALRGRGLDLSMFLVVVDLT